MHHDSCVIHVTHGISAHHAAPFHAHAVSAPFSWVFRARTQAKKKNKNLEAHSIYTGVGASPVIHDTNPPPYHYFSTLESVEISTDHVTQTTTFYRLQLPRFVLA